MPACSPTCCAEGDCAKLDRTARDPGAASAAATAMRPSRAGLKLSEAEAAR